MKAIINQIKSNENVQVALFFGTVLTVFTVFGIYLFSNYTPSFGW